MFRLIGLVVVLALGAAGMFAWDRHGPIGFTVPIPIWRPHLGLPDSLATQRDRAVAAAGRAQASLAVCHVSESNLQAAIGSQNAAVERMKAQADIWSAQGRQAIQAARAVAESYRQQARAIDALPAPSGDRCAAADALILQEASR